LSVVIIVKQCLTILSMFTKPLKAKFSGNCCTCAAKSAAHTTHSQHVCQFAFKLCWETQKFPNLHNYCMSGLPALDHQNTPNHIHQEHNADARQAIFKYNQVSLPTFKEFQHCFYDGDSDLRVNTCTYPHNFPSCSV
jgi:hypothetical protein